MDKYRPEPETRTQVILRTAFLVVVLAVLAVVLAGYTISVWAEPDVCADVVGGNCIP